MKKASVFLAILATAISISSSPALAAEKLYVCRPCSRDFIPVARKVIQEMGLDLEVTVKTTGCLGYCSSPAVLEFRDEIYKGMDEGKLRSMLEASVQKEDS